MPASRPGAATAAAALLAAFAALPASGTPPEVPLTPAAGTEAEAPADPGQSWAGREGDGFDFTLARSGEDEGGRVLYQYRGRSAADGSERSGIVELIAGARHVKAVLVAPNGTRLRVYDGTFFPDGRTIAGSVWPIGPDGARGGRLSWFATIERGPVPAPARIDLNRATVAEMEAAGLGAPAARTIVFGRLLQPFRDVEDAASGPGLTDQDRAVLREKGDVR